MLHTMFRTNTAYPVVLRCADRLLEIIAEALVQAYIDVHFPDLFVGTENTATRMCDVSTKRKFFSVIDSRIQQVDIQYLATHLGLPLSRAQLGRWYDRIIARRAPVAYKNSTALLNIPRGPSPQLTVPQLLLTGFSYWYQEHDFATSIGDPRPVAVETHGRCTAKDLREFLGCRIPVVEPYAAWYVRWQWAYDLVCEAIGGKALTEIQKAALLEELHVF
ncbi:unnamed protein product [Cercospora beticola]|nr:unnamed protein product [Cercospora beticola]